MGTADEIRMRVAGGETRRTDEEDKLAPASNVFGAPADIEPVPMDALDTFRRKKVLAFRIKWLKALEEGASRDLRALEVGSVENERPRSK
jgi:hypothetical protein